MPEDFITYIVATDERGHTRISKRVNFLGVKAPEKTQRKNRLLVYGYFDLFLWCCRKYDPMLALPVALQAYAGLREGEVINLSREKVKLISTGYGRIGRIELILLLEADFARHHDGKTGFGSIKKTRIQEVYSDFVSEIQKLINAHDEHLISKGLQTDKKSPLFYNRWGKPMTVDVYVSRVKSLFYDRFLPALKLYCKKEGIWAENAAYIEAYESNYPGAHMFRHWFTMYLLMKTNLSREEISHWRGDRNSQSMEDYIHVNADMLNLYQKSSFLFQSTVLEEIL